MDQKIISRAIEHLPVPTSVIRRINRVISNPDVSGADVADAISLDPILCGKVLRLANSAYVGLPNRVSSLPHAVVLLGIKRVHSLVLTSELITPLSKQDALPFSLDRFRRHAVTVAYVAESIARHLKRYDAMDEHELFSGALLHDIGKLLAGIVDKKKVRETYETARKQNIPFYRAEKEELSHTVLGHAIAEKWHLPPELGASIRGHHTPACFPELHRTVSVVHIADVMTHLLGYPIYADEKTPNIDDGALQAIQLPFERLRVIGEEILKKQERIASLLEILDG